MTEVHCEYCQCPIELWKKSMKTYDGDECKLYESFMDLIPFEYDISPQQLTIIALNKLPLELQDIADIEATVKELVKIAIECGVISE